MSVHNNSMNSTDCTILNATLEDFKEHISMWGYCTLKIDLIIKIAINTNRAFLKNNPKQS